MDNIECTNIGILGIPEREESKWYFFLFEEIIVENFPNLGNKACLQLQEAQSTKQDQSKEVHNKTHFN